MAQNSEQKRKRSSKSADALSYRTWCALEVHFTDQAIRLPQPSYYINSVNLIVHSFKQTVLKQSPRLCAHKAGVKIYIFFLNLVAISIFLLWEESKITFSSSSMRGILSVHKVLSSCQVYIHHIMKKKYWSCKGNDYGMLIKLILTSLNVVCMSSVPWLPKLEKPSHELGKLVASETVWVAIGNHITVSLKPWTHTCSYLTYLNILHYLSELYMLV
jgi:hypothetical protein